MPLVGILCPKHPAGMLYKRVDGTEINMNGIPHKLSGGIHQGNLMLYVLVCCSIHRIWEKVVKYHLLKVWS